MTSLCTLLLATLLVSPSTAHAQTAPVADPPAADSAATDSADGDVVATYHLSADPQAVTQKVADLTVQEALLSGCTRHWTYGAITAGVGAGAQLVYRVGLWRRKLLATVTVVDDGRQVTVDHAGNKGFYTTWTVTAGADSGSDVELRTLMNPPPKPFRRYYTRHVQPAWQACYAQALVRLDNDLSP